MSDESSAYEAFRERLLRGDERVRDEYDKLGARFLVVRELLDARRRAGMTQANLASAMGTTRSVISRLESGRHSPSVDTLAAAARALGCSLEIRLRDVDRRTRPDA